MEDYQIIAQLERSTPNELRRLLKSPTIEEARVYKTYFGKERFDRLRRQVLSSNRRSATRGLKRGNAVVLHGIMGGELSLRENGQRIWMHPWRLALGGLGWLRMDESGRPVHALLPAGILMKWYAELLIGLSEEWDVHAYWYDWRLDLNETADDLRRRIDGWFGAEEPVNLIAHSMGGLVSRTYIHQHPKRWEKGGKLIMIGTPNHGAFSIPRVITGTEQTVRRLALVDTKHSLDEVTDILGKFPGALQMLPSPLVMPTMESLYKAETWNHKAPQSLLDGARQHHETLSTVVDGSRMHYIAGDGQWTFNDIMDWEKMRIDTDGTKGGYRSDTNGDGTVPHRLGILEQDGQQVPTWFVHEEHGALPNNPAVVTATKALLVDDTCELPSKAGEAVPTKRSADALRLERARVDEANDERFESICIRLAARQRAIRSEDADEEPPLSAADVLAADMILEPFLTAKVGRQDALPTRRATRRRATERPKLKIELHLGGIQVDLKKAGIAADAISVGHYIGVAPQNAELAIDRAISGWSDGDSEEGLILTGFYQRRAIGGQLGHQFTLTDPRDAKRTVVLAGMGLPGQFNDTKLSILARELSWMLGHTGRKHLATVLIGAGNGNLSISDAVRAWFRGLDRGLGDSLLAGRTALQTLTFIEYSPENFVELNHALHSEVDRYCQLGDDVMMVIYDGPSSASLRAAEKAGKERVAQRWLTGVNARDLSLPTNPVRLSIRLEGDEYEFSALTSEASIPQETITVDPKLIEQINSELPFAGNEEEQLHWGRLFGTMLMPEKLREAIVPDVPVVLAVDASTARLHFEMTAMPLRTDGVSDDECNVFLGTMVSLTRQLRTELASVPEPQYMTRDRLKVLVVADPAAEAPLPGAQEEGEAVASLFEKLQSQGHPVDVTCLFGPSDATRVAVLRELVNDSYDILHYAGHCFFDEKNPSRSGWLFSGDEVLTARELRRVKNVPRFVFSNACESGIIADYENAHLALVAPSFAEAFFECGVANFVCTAWPVDDLAALTFAETLYKALLGFSCTEPEPMHKAMKRARLEVAANCGLGGVLTWGAYQHYGDPNARVWSASPAPTEKPKRAQRKPKKRVSAKKKRPARKRTASRRAKRS